MFEDYSEMICTEIIVCLSESYNFFQGVYNTEFRWMDAQYTGVSAG